MRFQFQVAFPRQIYHVTCRFADPDVIFFFLHMRCLKMSITVSKEAAVVIIIILSWNFGAYIILGI